MSHFSLAVITPNGYESEVDELLEPFSEHLEVERIIPKEELIENGRAYYESFKDKELYKEFLDDPRLFRESQKENIVEFYAEYLPKMLNRTDEEVYQDEIEGYDEDSITEDGALISYYNPNSKWDWWDIGGRWNNIITTKKGEKVNTAQIKDIDFGTQPEERAHFEDLWDVIVEGKEPTKDPFVYQFQKSKERILETYDSKEDYVKGETGFSTYAALTPTGDWIEPGEMGWFGTSTATPTSEVEYKEQFKQLMTEYSDYHLTVVDCHI